MYGWQIQTNSRVKTSSSMFHCYLTPASNKWKLILSTFKPTHWSYIISTSHFSSQLFSYKKIKNHRRIVLCSMPTKAAMSQLILWLFSVKADFYTIPKLQMYAKTKACTLNSQVQTHYNIYSKNKQIDELNNQDEINSHHRKKAY